MLIITHSVPDATLPATIVLFSLLLCAACTRKHLNTPPTDPLAADYVDLLPGHMLTITIPYVTSGGYTPKFNAAPQIQENESQEEQGTVTLSATDLLGFQVSHYSIAGGSDGRVRLMFKAAEISRDGNSAKSKIAPRLPFPLPQTRQHIRLVYYVRNSQADHNMAVLASDNLAGIESLTSQLKANPEACESSRTVLCFWVPPGVAVRTD